MPTPIPSVSVTYAADGSSTKENSMGMRAMQERAHPMPQEHDCVRLIEAETEDGESFPAGTTGVVVSVYNGGEAFGVEVFKSLYESAIITVFASQLEASK